MTVYTYRGHDGHPCGKHRGTTMGALIHWRTGVELCKECRKAVFNRDKERRVLNRLFGRRAVAVAYAIYNYPVLERDERSLPGVAVFHAVCENA